MTPTLGGARILVTRPVEQAEALCRLIEQVQASALRFPLLQIAPHQVAKRELEQALAADWLIFTSKNAVDFALQAFDGKMAGLAELRIAAVGGGTAKCLRAAGLRVDCVPQTQFNSEGLLAEAEMQNVAGKRCIIVRGVGGREKLAQTLRERGADVAYLEVYRRLPPDGDAAELAASLEQRAIDALVITSEEALQNLAALLDSATLSLAQKLPLVVVSERLRQAAEKLQFEIVVVSQQASDTAILETLRTLFNGENSGRSN